MKIFRMEDWFKCRIFLSVRAYIFEHYVNLVDYSLV